MDGQHPVPHGLGKLRDAPVLPVDERHVGRAVEEHVEAAVAGDHVIHQSLHLLAGRDIDRRRLAADAGGDRLRALRPQVGHDDRRALARERLGARATDARAAAGDERDLAAQTAAHLSLPRAATGHVASTRPPRWATTSSCRFVVPHAWFGRTVTTSPISGRASHADRST